MRILSLPIFTLLLSGPAFAGGVAPDRTPVYSPPPVVAQTDWTAFYGGLQVETLDGETGAFDFDGSLAGLFAGYRYDFGSITVGGEIDYVHGMFDLGSLTLGAAVFDLDYDVRVLRLGGEIGYDLGSVLPYATAGYADLQIEFDPLAVDASDSGYFYGLGLDFQATDRILIGAEALRHEFSDFNGGDDVGFTTLGINVGFAF